MPVLKVPRQVWLDNVNELAKAIRRDEWRPFAYKEEAKELKKITYEQRWKACTFLVAWYK